jgi:hypothetical protein
MSIFNYLCEIALLVLQATANTRLVGAIGGHFLKYLHEFTGLDLYHVHMIDHSLGAHVSG